VGLAAGAVQYPVEPASDVEGRIAKRRIGDRVHGVERGEVVAVEHDVVGQQLVDRERSLVCRGLHEVDIKIAADLDPFDRCPGGAPDPRGC
jgi:hypothetical protein